MKTRTRVALALTLGILLLALVAVFFTQRLSATWEQRIATVSLENDQLLWESIVAQQHAEMASALPAIRRDRELRDHILTRDRDALNQLAITTYRLLAASRAIDAKQLLAENGDVLFSMPPPVTADTQSQAAKIALESGKDIFDIARTDDGKLVFQFAFPLFKRGQIIGAGLFMRYSDDAIKQYKATTGNDLFVVFANDASNFPINKRMAAVFTAQQIEAIIGNGKYAERQDSYYDVKMTPLTDISGEYIATLISIRDVTAAAIEIRALRALGVASILASFVIIAIALVIYLRRAFVSVERDELTGLKNRRFFNEFLEGACERRHKTKLQQALLFIDLDQFRVINDEYGHHVGDSVLKAIAQRMVNVVAPNDNVFRLAGDQFAIVLEVSSEQLLNIAETLLESLAEPIAYRESMIDVSARIGISIIGKHSQDPDTLTRFADLALHQAKRNDKNRIELFDPKMEEDAKAKAELLEKLNDALAAEAFEMYYQAKYSLQADSVIGYEALLRWPIDNGAFIPPDLLIPLAEESGQMDQIGEWVIQTACRDLAQAHACKPGITMAINLSPSQFDDPALISKLCENCDKYGLDHSQLELEITETMLMSNFDQGIDLLDRLSAHGFRIALDDFGTGYSSLQYLQKMPVTSLKIDRSFTQAGLTDKKCTAIIDMTIALANQLNLTVVAEGVETRTQLDYLRAAGCDQIQGYYFSKPCPLSEALEIRDDKLPTD